MISNIVTSALFLLFLAGWIWAWNPKRKAEFDAAARLPLAEDTTDHSADHKEPAP